MVTPWLTLVGNLQFSVYATAQGLTYALLSFVLERQGIPRGAAGLSAAITPLSFLCYAPLVPIVSRRFGRGRTALVSAFAGATTPGRYSKRRRWLLGSRHRRDGKPLPTVLDRPNRGPTRRLYWWGTLALATG